MNLKIAQSVRRAFTLAELLIVIAIIGIIAAVTIPLVSANSQKLQSISALQKANNTFANMVCPFMVSPLSPVLAPGSLATSLPGLPLMDPVPIGSPHTLVDVLVHKSDY